MMNLKDLWVGDVIRIKSSGEIAHFHSIVNNKAQVKLPNGQLLIVDPDNLENYEEPVSEPDPFPELAETPASSTPSLKSSASFPTTLDLHMEKLNPDMARARPERILSYQLEALEDYMEAAEQRGIKIVTLIHGKGTGVLKAETLHLLKGRPAVKFTVATNDGGAVEVWLR